MPGMFDQMKAIAKAKKVQNDLKKTEIEASGGDGAVTVVFTGELKLQSITIAERMLAPERKQELERLIKDTMTQAMQQAQALAAEKTREVMKQMGVNLPGL
ncbi:YbaB/EbfC family nucleoid-associated protein [Candidatus Berkelbacteria bacterium]|nr:YbaB/EbfC family nucleoid-associated protein [Candidatus Berkelbacteria bacterium]